MKAPDHITSRFIYPFPFLKNPLSEEIQRYIEDFLIDVEYREIGYPENILDVYKRTRTARIAGWWFPTVSYERLIPLSRFMTWTMAHDDIFEQRSEERIREAAVTVVGILKGDIKPHDTDYILGGQLYRLRHALLHYMSPKAVDRFADMVGYYMDGLAEESQYDSISISSPSYNTIIAVMKKALYRRWYASSMSITGKPCS